MSDDINLMLPKALEEAFNKDMAESPINFDAALEKLLALRAARKDAVTERLARTLQSALISDGNYDGLIKLLTIQAEWLDDVLSFGSRVPLLLKKATRDRSELACMESVKFGAIKPTESFRRLALLRSIKPGDFFFDKTWGFGSVKRIDPFYKRLIIDFIRKADHIMTLEYAAEALTPLSPDHFLVRIHAEGGEIREHAMKRPCEFVKMIIETFGPSTVIRLEKLLVDYGLINAKDWKPFWEKARKEIKDNARINLPLRRTEPITVRNSELVYDEAWFTDELKKERNIPNLFEIISTYENTVDKPEITDVGRKILTERMNFAIDGAFLCPPPMFTRMILMARRLDIETPNEELIEKLIDDDRFMEAGDKLSARESEELVEFIISGNPEAVGMLLEKLPKMSFNFTCKTLDVLRSMEPYAKSVQDRCRSLLAAAEVPSALLVWTIRNWEEVKDWGLPSLYELMEHALAIIEKRTLVGEQLRLQKLLIGFYSDIKWFESAFTSLNDLQREAIFFRLDDNSKLHKPMFVRALIDKMLQIAPVLASKKIAPKSASAKPVSLTRYTSWRSFYQRQKAYRNLVDVEMPRNRDDISYARALGDLRENFEYQSAKENQRLLMARREELESALKTVRGSNFPAAEIKTDVVGMGVMVVIERSDGSRQTYAILGEWDSDDGLGILPYRSRLAMSLVGKAVGATAQIPSATAEDEMVKIVEIRHLDPQIRAWLAVTQESVNAQ